MKTLGILFLAGMCLAGVGSLWAESWTLESSTLTYHVTHVLHKVEGVSREARGKAVCDPQGCRFLVAAPVVSFRSEDTNRDLHMLETTRGAQFSLVKVQGALPNLPSLGAFTADIDVEFAGEKKTYPAVAFTLDEKSDQFMGLHGTIPLNIDDFHIPAPSLLGMAIQSSVPVEVEMRWTSKP